jgi:hypothetical protein
LSQRATEQKFSLAGFQVAALDAWISVSGGIENYLEKGVNHADMTFQGNLGPEATQWVSELIRLPSEISIRPPVSISKAHLVWDRAGKTTFVGNLVVNKGPKVSIDFLQTPKELTIKHLHVEDETSNSSLNLSSTEKEISLGFTGKLTEKTMRRLHRGYQLLRGRIEGDFRTRVFLEQPMRSTAQGRLMAQDIIVPVDIKMPMKIDSMALAAQDNKVNLESAICTWGDTSLDLTGTLSTSETDLLFDMDVSTDLLEVNKLVEGLGEDPKQDDGRAEAGSWDLPLQGTLRLKSKNLTFEGYNWSPVNADISFKHGTLIAVVTQADLCGISTPGELEITAKDLRLDFEPVSKNQDINFTLDCLWGAKGTATGRFDLESKVMSQGRTEDVVRSFQGNIEFRAEDGRIYMHDEFGVLGKVFTRLSVTEMFQGKLPDMNTAGFPYKTAKIRAKLGDGKLSLDEAHINGEGMQVFGHGNVDLVNENLDLEIAVAPFKTVDTVVKHTPLIGRIFGGTLVSVPVKVTGDWSDPQVDAMDPSSVGSGLLGIIQRTVTLPVDLVQPLAPEEKEK